MVASKFVIQRRTPLTIESAMRTSLERRRLIEAAGFVTNGRENLAQFGPIPGGAPAAYLVTDAYGKILDGNDAASFLLQMKVTSLAGRRLRNHIALASRPMFYATMEKLKASTAAVKDVTFEIRPLRSASRVNVSLSALGRHDAAGRLLAVHWLMRGPMQEAR